MPQTHMTGLAEEISGVKVRGSLTETQWAHIRAEDLPLRIEFNGRRYVIDATRTGGLIMTGDRTV